MGQSVGSFISHPLTGLALQVGYAWLSSVDPEEKLPAEQSFLNTLAANGLNASQLGAIMPNQEDYINRMQHMETQIQAERAMTRKHQDAYKKMKRKLEEQMKKTQRMEEYLAQAPSKPLRLNSDIKLSSQEAAAKNGIDNKTYINFAFVGHTKNGKSSLINAIRGLNKDDNGAAGVDVLECTHNLTFYTIPNGKMPNVRFYDVPGSGAMSHKAENYYQEKALCGFDCLIIFVQQTLAEEEIKFALAALEYDQKVVFVRSKCDIDFHLKDESGTTLRTAPSEQEIKDHIHELRTAFDLELQKHAAPLSGIKCFFVSAKSMRAIIRGEPSDMVFEEAEFLDFLYQQSKKARGISTF